MRERLCDHLRKYRDWHFLSKGIDWAPEREYRWVVSMARRPRLVDIRSCLGNVIVGMNFSPSDERALHMQCAPHGVRVDRTRWRNRRPHRDIGGLDEGWGRRDRLKTVPIDQVEFILYDGSDPLM